MHFPVLLLAIVSLCSIAATSPLQGRQVAPGNSSIADLIAQCAPYSFDIHQFTTFSGSDTAPPQISFFFTNENDVDVNGAAGNTAVFCSVTLPMYENIMSDYTVWSCQSGTGFKFDTNSVLTVSQSMICDALYPGAPIWTLASGTIDTTSQSGVDGGVFNTSIETDDYLTVVDIVESIPTSVPNLPTCGQMCISAELMLGPSFDCSPSNYTCLCASNPFTTAFRDCLMDSCRSEDETQESKDYFDDLCVGGGTSPATESPLTPSGSGCDAGSQCL